MSVLPCVFAVSVSSSFAIVHNSSAFEDFTPAARFLTLPPSAGGNSSVMCTMFEILEDKIAFEGEETVLVTIVLPLINATRLGDNSTALVVISDNDGEK